jgi:hypothetical protein
MEENFQATTMVLTEYRTKKTPITLIGFLAILEECSKPQLNLCIFSH